MKKLRFILTLILLCSLELEAVQCRGSHFYFTDPDDLARAWAHARLNCCAGSSIEFTNLKTGQHGFMYIHEHGLESSCYEREDGNDQLVPGI